METYLFIGLGNVGKEFERTRHNIGERVLRTYVEQAHERGLQVSPWKIDSSFNADVCTITIPGKVTIWCVFPLLMMNESGKPVASFLRMHPVEPDHMLIIHDDLETPFGEVRVKNGGSAKGHNGVRSIQETTGTQETSRMLIGIGRPPGKMHTDRFVLEKFSELEEETLAGSVVPEACTGVDGFLGL